MVYYIIRRLFSLTITLLLTSIVIFTIVIVIPGDVATTILGQEATPEALASLRESLGLNRPAYTRYIEWAQQYITGDWGTSLATRTAVLPMVAERLRNSLKLASLCLVISIPISIFLGVLSGFKKNTWIDNSVAIGTLTFAGIPEFVTGMFFLFFFAVQLNLFPAMAQPKEGAGLLENIHALFLPALTLSLVFSAHITRMTRSSVIEVLRTAYIRTAELKGLPRIQIIFAHVLRNALIPTITIIAMSLGWLVAGTIVVETVFSYPGLGRLLIWSIRHRDVPLIMAISMLLALVIGLGNLCADVLYAVLNPRIRLS